jgi:hypothetical protein
VYAVSDFIPDINGMTRSHRALYELIGEPVRELMAALHLRQQAAD